MPGDRNKTCANCGRAEVTDAPFCAHCGARYPDDVAPVMEVQKSSDPAPGNSGGERSKAKLIATAAAAVLIVAAVVVGGVLKVRHDNTVAKEEKAAALKAKRHAAAVDAYKTCKDTVGELVNAEVDLDGRLDVGLTFADYSSKVGDVSAAYHQVTFDDLEGDCLSNVGVPAEAAMNSYDRTAAKWNDCIQSVDCSVDDLDLSSSWGRAKVKVEEAQSSLEALNPDS